jgi:hypothetical protein
LTLNKIQAIKMAVYYEQIYFYEISAIKKKKPQSSNKKPSPRVARRSSRGDGGKGPQGPGLTSKAKDMLKVTGQKPNIKLTLLVNKKVRTFITCVMEWSLCDPFSKL